MGPVKTLENDATLHKIMMFKTGKSYYMWILRSQEMFYTLTGKQKIVGYAYWRILAGNLKLVYRRNEPNDIYNIRRKSKYGKCIGALH